MCASAMRIVAPEFGLIFANLEPESLLELAPEPSLVRCLHPLVHIVDNDPTFHFAPG